MEKNNNREWTNILSVILRNRKDILKLITDEDQRIRLQFFCVYIIFGLISLGMTAMNVFTGWHFLGLGTGVFGAGNIINVVLCLISYRAEKVSRILFSVEVIVVFSYFAIIGEPEGFSVIWIVLLAVCGVLLYGMKYGTMLALIQFAILVFLLWTPVGRELLLYDYTGSFMMRFPILYLAFLFVGLFFELVIVLTQKELIEARNSFEYQSIHDPLTGILNRGGFNRTLDEFVMEHQGKSYAFAIADLDKFKDVNDTYGHQNGDVVLKYVAGRLTELVGEGGTVCRWGGEEFAIFMRNGTDAEALCDKIRRDIKKKVFRFNGSELSISISMGLVNVPAGYAGRIANVITASDENLYYAKEHGRDMVYGSDMQVTE